jgi:NMD protein affecting ribosome stability and mRNA decay
LQSEASRPAREPAVCEVCGAVYRNRRWVRAGKVQELPANQAFEPPLMTVCPACEKRAQQMPCGFVYLRGGYLREHLTEIEKLLRKEADRAADDNPTGRILEWGDEKDGEVVLTTSTEHLAQRLGRSLERAFGGAVRYDFSHENKLARVYWQRD